VSEVEPADVGTTTTVMVAAAPLARAPTAQATVPDGPCAPRLAQLATRHRPFCMCQRS
jgi:hypothetical protein